MWRKRVNVKDELDEFENEQRKVIEKLEKIAEEGNVHAPYLLGAYYYRGLSGEKDLEKAFKWFLIGAERDNALAQYWTAMFYANGIYITQDHVKALEYFYKLSEFAKDDTFEMGFILPKDTTSEFKKQLQEYSNEAFKLQIKAFAAIGTYLLYGEKGIAKDYDAARKWFRKAAKLGNVDAQVNLGIIYYDGLGVNHNKQEALKWLKMAADQGDKQANQFINTILSD